MAISVLGPLLQGVSGTLGGMVFHAGKRAGVLAKPACRVAGVTDAQAARQRLVAALTARWFELDDVTRRMWGTYAATHPMPNRLSVYRTVGAFQTFVAYCMLVYPDGVVGSTGWYAPTGPVTQAPVVTACAIAAHGPATVTVANAGAAYTVGYLCCERHVYVREGSGGTVVSVGTRARIGASGYVGGYLAGAGVCDIWPALSAKFGSLEVGEYIKVRTYWVKTQCWPSSAVEVLVKVTA